MAATEHHPNTDHSMPGFSHILGCFSQTQLGFFKDSMYQTHEDTLSHDDLKLHLLKLHPEFMEQETKHAEL